MYTYNICSNRELLFLLLYTSITVLSLLGPGSNIGYSSIALPVLISNNTSIKLNDDEVPLFASLPIISQIFGCLASAFTLKHGRRVALISGSTVCATGWIIITFSHNTVFLFIGRILTGFSTGLCASPGTVYLGEISKPQWRAVFTSCTSLFISNGVVLVYLFGFFMRDNWQGVAALCIICPTASVLATFFFLPESPMWLLTKGRMEEARESLFRIRGLKHETVKFQEEFTDMVNYIKTSRNVQENLEGSGSRETTDLSLRIRSKYKNVLNILRLAEVWKPLVILISYFFFQQFTGLYVLMTYMVDVVVQAGVTIDPFLMTVLLGVIQSVGGVINIISSTKVGRRKISIISGTGMSISLALLAINGQFVEQLNLPTLSLACFIIYMAAGSFGFVVLPWAMIGELYPSQYVNILGPLTTCLGGVFNFAIVQVYPAMADYNIVFTLYFYCIISVIATLFMTFFLPETHGKTKLQIEERFKGSFVFG